MKKLHKLSESQIKYGFLMWSKKENYAYKRIFSYDPVDVKIKDITLPNIKLNPKYNRIYIGKWILKRYFEDGDYIIIQREDNENLVTIKKYQDVTNNT